MVRATLWAMTTRLMKTTRLCLNAKRNCFNVCERCTQSGNLLLILGRRTVLYNPGGHSSDESPWRDIFGNDGPRGYGCTVTNGNAGKDDGVSTNPHVVADDYFVGVFEVHRWRTDLRI
mmetsp:Transcript_7369/g.20972  ORF Transcript_7369/g.20972 Transcript_7369/m.20972 type:complete len:118 (+) Transcript_7369:130-483(+)